MPNGDLQGDAAAKRIAHKSARSMPRYFISATMFVGHCPRAKGPVDIGSASVALQFDGDNLPLTDSAGRFGPNMAIPTTPPCKQDQRFSGTVNLVVELEAVTGA